MRILSTVAILALFASGQAGADEEVAWSFFRDKPLEDEHYENEGATLQESVECCGTPCCVEECRIACGQGCGGWAIGADYLYWQVLHEDLIVAGVGPVMPGKVKKIEFGFDNGYRVRAGYSNCDSWDIFGQYTWYKTSASRTVKSATPHSDTASDLHSEHTPSIVVSGDAFQIAPYNSISVQYGTDRKQSVSRTVKFCYQLADFDIARKLIRCTNFDFSTVFGARGAWIDEKRRSKTSGVFALSGEGLAPTIPDDSISAFLDYTVSSKTTWRFNGGGLKFGFMGSVPFCGGFSLDLGGDVSLLVGCEKARYKRDAEIANTTRRFAVFIPMPDIFREYYALDGSEDSTTMKSNFNAHARLSWEWNCGCFRTRLRAGYDMVYWIGLLEVLTNMRDKPFLIEDLDAAATPYQAITSGKAKIEAVSEDVGLHGLTISLDFYF